MNESAFERGYAIELRDCGKTFSDGTTALQPVSLKFEAGETIVILGPSGCGKTTMLRLIAGLEHPNFGGEVWIGGQNVTAVPIEKRNVGMVFQSYALFPNMNVLGNVAYGLKVRGVPRAEREANAHDVLSMMRIDELAHRGIDQLSGGQRQRVALARALAVRPRVLLLDEPLTALDATLRETLRTEIDRLLRQLGITAVYVTHDQQEAMILGDRVIVMAKGEIAQIGSPQMIYRQPSSRYVAEFVGNINRLDGRLETGALSTAAGRLALGNSISQGADREFSVYFRPEAVKLVAAEDAALRGRVVVAHFHGATKRFYIETNAGPELIVDADNITTAAPGDTVGLQIDSDRLMVFEQ